MEEQCPDSAGSVMTYLFRMTSLSRRSRFLILLLCCAPVIYVLYSTTPKKPNVHSLETLKKVWNIGQHNNDHIDQNRDTPATLTHATNSMYRFVNTRDLVIQRGVITKLVIEARDLVNRKSATGGDMWYATLNSLRPKASSAGRVIDNEDGTYDVLFYAGWEGVTKVDVILVHPSDACRFVKETVWPAQDRAVWVGTFGKLKKSRTETKTCLLRREEPGWEEKCVYWRPKELGDTLIICGKPADEELSCGDLSAIGVLDARVAVTASELVEGKEHLFLRENEMQIVQNGPKHVKIEGTGARHPLDLPPCKPDLPDPTVEGFWLDGQWKSLRCRNTQWGQDVPTERVNECLHGKRVYFMGDVTVRQRFEAFHDAIGLKFLQRHNDSPYKLFRHYPQLDISIVYQAHPFLVTSSRVPFAEVEYEVHMLDNLTNPDCMYAVFLSPWSSRISWERASFMEYLTRLREAVLRFTSRCPGVTVVVRGPHPVAHGTSKTPVYADNIILSEMRDIVKKSLVNTGLSFMDVWDMALAYPTPNQMTVPQEVIQQEVYMFLSYVC